MAVLAYPQFITGKGYTVLARALNVKGVHCSKGSGSPGESACCYPPYPSPLLPAPKVLAGHTLSNQEPLVYAGNTLETESKMECQLGIFIFCGSWRSLPAN